MHYLLLILGLFWNSVFTNDLELTIKLAIYKKNPVYRMSWNVKILTDSKLI